MFGKTDPASLEHGQRFTALQRGTKWGKAPEEIARELPPISLASVYAALAYYQANQAEIEAELAADAVEEDRLETEWLLTRGTQAIYPLTLSEVAL